MKRELTEAFANLLTPARWENFKEQEMNKERSDELLDGIQNVMDEHKKSIRQIKDAKKKSFGDRINELKFAKPRSNKQEGKWKNKFVACFGCEYQYVPENSSEEKTCPNCGSSELKVRTGKFRPNS